jgi:SnoaL-like polyketide cyclase
MAAEDNKAAVRRFYEEVINGTDLDAIDELLTPHGVDHTFGSQSAEEAKQFFGMLYQAFPDLRVEVNDVIAEADLVPPGSPTRAPTRESLSASQAPAGRPRPAGSTSSGCRTASRPSIGADRTWPICSSSLASCPHRARRLAVTPGGLLTRLIGGRPPRAVWAR